MNLSRRTLLAATGVTAAISATTLATSAGAAHAQSVGAADETLEPVGTVGFGALLQRAETLLTGGAFDPSDTDFVAAVAALDTTAKGLWETLDRGAGRTALWPDLSPVTDPGNFGQSYTRLRTLTTAWATPGTSLAKQRGGGGHSRRRAALRPRHRVQPGQARDGQLVVLGDRRPSRADGLFRPAARPSSGRRSGGLSGSRRPLLPGRGPSHQLPHARRDGRQPHGQGGHRRAARAAGTGRGQTGIGP